jgi:hypothetical protein
MQQKPSEDDSFLKAYADLKAERTRIDERLEEFEPKILAYLAMRGIDTLQESYGTFSVVNRKRWTYTPELMQKELEYTTVIKNLKAEEQDNGEAKAEDVKNLSYRQYVVKEETKK